MGQLVDFATTMFTANRSRPLSSNERAQLLVIVSDGRVMSEGPDKVKQAVRRAKQSGIFMVFVIVDNPESKVMTFEVVLVVTPDNRHIEISFLQLQEHFMDKIRHLKILCHESPVFDILQLCV